MPDREKNKTVTLTMTGFEPPMRTLRDRLEADGPFDSVAFSAKSDRWPEEVRVTARNKLWDLHFKCDSNEVCWLALLDGTRRSPRAHPKVGFSLFGLLKGPTIGPLCDGLSRFLQALTKFLQNPLQGDLDEATRQQVRVAFEEYTVILDNSNLMPLSSLDGQKIDAFVDLFVSDHPQIFNHPTIEVCNIYRVSEVKDWLLARSDSANADSLEFKLLCYCVFKTVQNLCHRAYAAEMLFRYK
jgi:hypothetical protein